MPSGTLLAEMVLGGIGVGSFIAMFLGLGKAVLASLGFNAGEARGFFAYHGKALKEWAEVGAPRSWFNRSALKRFGVAAGGGMAPRPVVGMPGRGADPERFFQRFDGCWELRSRGGGLPFARAAEAPAGVPGSGVRPTPLFNQLSSTRLRLCKARVLRRIAVIV